MKDKKIYYYSDELEDDFVPPKNKTRVIDGSFNYIHKNFFWNIAEFFVYRIIMMPFASVYNKIKFRHKIVGKGKLKIVKKSGYFMYANHTIADGDAFIPNRVNAPRKTYTIVHPSNLSHKIGNNFLRMCGGTPLPSDIPATKNFISALEYFSNKGCAIQIYPEAHIWPYYTNIRPFKESSFRYPVKFDKPVFCFTNTFHQRRKGKVKVITYIDGPFYADKTLPQKEQEKKLRDEVYNAMIERAKLNTYEFVTYIKKQEDADKI